MFRSIDDLLASKGLSRSETLSNPQDYSNIHSNPILACLVDQCNSDPELQEASLTQSSILNMITDGLNNKRLNWKWKWSITITKQAIWITNLQENKNFYHGKENKDDYENILLDLACQLLERKINLYSFNSGNPRKDLTFTPPRFKHYLQTFKIVRIDHFSVPKKEFSRHFVSVYKTASK